MLTTIQLVLLNWAWIGLILANFMINDCEHPLYFVLFFIVAGPIIWCMLGPFLLLIGTAWLLSLPFKKTHE